jgi:glucokinase
MTSCVIALDVGGTAMKGALLDRSLTALAQLRRPTRPVRPAKPITLTAPTSPTSPTSPNPGTADGSAAGSDVNGIVGAIGDALAHLVGLAEAEGLTVRGVGVAVPGIVDEIGGRAVYSANLGWRDLPLAGLLAERLALPVALGHDVRAGARAEAAVGAARGVRDVVFIPVGTGIAGAAICGGEPLSGGGFAGEIGHLVVRPGGEICQCTGRGCLETVASAAAIAARFTALSGHRAAGAAEVVRWLDQGDESAREVWDEAIAALADALAATVTLLAPELIVIGGGLAEAGDRLLVPLRAQLAERLTFQRRPRLVRAELGDRAGCLGAGLLAWEQAEKQAVPVGSAGSAGLPTEALP